MMLDEAIQFSGADPMENLKAKVSTLPCNITVADLAKHEIVAALNPIHVPSPRLFIQ
jgi:hypothetical protein